MKSQYLFFNLVIGLMIFQITFKAYTADSTTTTATAKVVSPVTLVKTADLLFGTIIPTMTAGTVTMSPIGGRTSSNVTLSTIALGNAAAFYLTGKSGSGFSIVLPSNITLTGPGASMQLSVFKSTPSLVGSFNTSGNATVNVGATLAVGANQAAGVYSGSFSITVDYN